MSDLKIHPKKNGQHHEHKKKQNTYTYRISYPNETTPHGHEIDTDCCRVLALSNKPRRRSVYKIFGRRKAKSRSALATNGPHKHRREFYTLLPFPLPASPCKDAAPLPNKSHYFFYLWSPPEEGDCGGGGGGGSGGGAEKV